jgi:hypothetical protein
MSDRRTALQGVCHQRAKWWRSLSVVSEIPSRHVPGFTVEPGVTLIPPNDLVDLIEPADHF